ncbi:DUF7535 family protein [Haloarchaeobius sp. TZWWS8]|uniref:DUF7535 family protein n=1 Tax=Haloarchaeobius sp. TZWWS8 TaxID=3446121 RepID=UPI003EBB0022
MSPPESDESAPTPAPAAKRLLRTVTAPVRPHPDADMSLIGWVMFALLLLLLLPVLPVLALVWVVSKMMDALQRGGRPT